MINTALTGMRCRATKEIRSHQGLISRFTEGTIHSMILLISGVTSLVSIAITVSPTTLILSRLKSSMKNSVLSAYRGRQCKIVPRGLHCMKIPSPNPGRFDGKKRLTLSKSCDLSAPLTSGTGVAKRFGSLATSRGLGR